MCLDCTYITYTLANVLMINFELIKFFFSSLCDVVSVSGLHIILDLGLWIMNLDVVPRRKLFHQCYQDQYEVPMFIVFII